jgi:D-alanine-D-alanine ligase
VKVAVLFGGDSMERDVSVASAAQVVDALRSAGHGVLAVDTKRGVLSTAEEKMLFSSAINRRPPTSMPAVVTSLPAIIGIADLRKVDLIFLALHGGSGEDGTVQAVLELAGIPYTGSSALGSALAMDKDVAKRLFFAAGIPTPDWLMAPAEPEDVRRRLGFPVIVKPNREGSTVGLTLVDGFEGLLGAIDTAAQFGGEVLIERFIPGRELTVGILDDRALAVGEIIPSEGLIFDYAAKYQAGGAREIFPADLPAHVTAAVQELALRAHRCLKLGSYSRVDFRMDPQGGLWCLEVNTLPGLTPGSLLPQAAAASGISFPALCERISAAALERKSPRR